MLRNRNSFFTESGGYNQSYFPNQGPLMNPSPYQSSSNYQSFYAGPYPNQAPNQYNTNQNNIYQDDYENRLAKIERQINRLDARITKLENATKVMTTETTNSMYMV